MKIYVCNDQGSSFFFFFSPIMLVRNRDFLLKKCRHKYGNVVDNFWCFSFKGSCLWTGVQWSIPSFKNSQEIQYFSFSLGMLGKDSRFLPASFTTWEYSLKTLLVLVSFWVHLFSGKKNPNNFTISNFANGLRVFSALFLC